MKSKITNPEKLTSRQLTKYTDSLEVLRLMRTGLSFRQATNSVGVSTTMTKKFIGSSIFKRKNRIKPKKKDNLIRKLRINENGKEISILVKGNKKSRLIAQYYGSIGQALNQNNPTNLKKFQKRRLKDIHGKFHFFETDIEKLQLIELKKEEPEFFTIYGRTS